MAFNKEYLAKAYYAGGLGAAHGFVYDSADTLATVLGTDFITAGEIEHQMALGDEVLVRFFDSVTAKTVHYGNERLQVSAIDSDGNVTLSQIGVAAVTATADGTGTGQIPPGAKIVNVTSANANNIVTLPPPVVGTEIRLINTSGTGFELRSSAPATVGISGGTGASAESALASTALWIDVKCVSATNWIANSHVAASTESAVEAAA